MPRYFNPSEKELFLLRERDFGEVLNDSITFLKLQGKNFYRVLLFTVLPISLLYGIFVGLFMSDVQNIFASILEHSEEGNAPWAIFGSWSYLGAIAIGIVENLVILTVVYGFVNLFHKGEREFSIAKVWDEARIHLLRTFGGLVFFAVIIAVIVGVAAVLIGVAASALGPGGGFFMIFIVFILVMIAMVYAMIAFSMMIPSIVMERKGAVSSISRSIDLVSKNWGQTFLVLFVAYITISLVASVFNIPSAILQWLTTMHSIDSTVANTDTGWMQLLIVLGACLSAVGAAMTTPVIHLIISMQYYNLVERQDGLGLKALIETFGQEENLSEEEEEDY